MIVEILAADAVPISVRIVFSAEDAHIWDVGWEEVAEPVYAAGGRLGLMAVHVQAIDNNDAGNCQDDLWIR